ncbi:MULTISPECIES: hypothetical protein [unclassified Caballeronia]|uniref:hypothetical protein n=1 Tax=unclassified Caballeronia TaxID=2646786 RepID=UPI0028606198|nr:MULTISPECIES: hypothetical protein [unclassified Caballeronia]MDR5774455.1 hypothetical protein [Caballeronia sp. LZ002]MDR5849890.1 hypothetical protein [Caballeronia sp. LZ003]
MKAVQFALERIRKSINTADALNMRSSAVLVSDLRLLVEIAETAELERLTNAGSQIPVAER